MASHGMNTMMSGMPEDVEKGGKLFTKTNLSSFHDYVVDNDRSLGRH